MKILIRCNAGNKYGLGHLVRCIALAKVFEKKEHNVFFIIKTDNSYLINDFIKKAGFSLNKSSFLTETISKDEDVSIIIEYYKKNDYSFLILDHYEHNLQYQKRIFNANIKWAQFDYAANENILANIVINGNISATKKIYERITLPHVELCIGYKYAVVRSDLRSEKAKPESNRILIAMGGGNYPEQVIYLIKHVVSNQEYCFDIICNDIRLKSIIASSKNVYLHINEIDVLPIYRKSIAAITAGGVTAFELTALNIPVIIVPFAENQLANAKAFDDYNVALSFPDVNSFMEELNEKGLVLILEYLSEKFKLKKINIDNKGATRVVEKIHEIIL